MIKSRVFRVVDPDGKVYAGGNNTAGVYNSARTARTQMFQELKHRAANIAYRLKTGKDPIEYPALKIQFADIEWKDLEDE